MKEYFGIDYTRIFEKGAETCSQYDHSMGDSLKEYINIKIPEFIFDSKYKKICWGFIKWKKKWDNNKKKLLKIIGKSLIEL